MEQSTVADVAQFLIQQLHVVFFTNDNAERQGAFQALDACDGYQSGNPGITSQVLIGAALEVLKREAEPPQVRAYGAQLLTRHLEQLVGMVSGDTGTAIIDTTISMIPFVDIAAWMVAADTSAMVYGARMSGGDIGTALRPAHHHKAVASACGNLIAMCVSHQWPDKGGQSLIDTICPAGNNPSLASLPNTLRVVLDVMRICSEPPYKTLTNQRISQIKRGLITIAPNVSKAAVAALDQQYTYLNAVIAGRPGTAGLGDRDEVIQSVCSDMEAAIEVLALTCTRTPTTTSLIQHWWDLNVDAIFTAIVSLASQWASKIGGGQRETSNGSSPITMVCAAIDLVTNLTCSLSNEAFEAVSSMEPLSRLVQLISTVLYLADTASDVSQSLDNRYIAEKVGRLLVEGGEKITLLDTFLEKVVPDRPADSPLRIRRTAAIAASLLLRIPSVVIGTMAVQSLNTFIKVDIATVASLVDSIGSAPFFSPTSEEDRRNALSTIRTRLDMSYDVPSILDRLVILCKKNALNPWKTHPRGNNGNQEFIPLCPIDHPNNAQREHYSKLSTLAFTIANDEFLEMEQYTVAYGELRTATSNLLQGLATMFPAASGEFLKMLVHESLQLSAAQKGAEPSTRHGHVTQHGEVFPRWEACSYILSTMLDGVSRSPFASTQQGAQLFTSLYNSILRNPLVDTTSSSPTMDGGGEAEVFPDAVLAPQYLNCVFHVLRCGAHGVGGNNNSNNSTTSTTPSEVSCQAIMMPKSPLVVIVEAGQTGGFEVGYQDVVRHSLDVISAFMDLRCGSLRGARVYAFREDEDLLSARKRSFTILISIGDTFDSLMAGAGVAGSLVGTISRLMMTGERLLPPERTLLIEAIACLSTSIEGLMGFLGTYLRGLLCEIDVLQGRVDPDRLAYLLTTSNSADISAFSGAKEAIDTVAKVLKRCKPSDSLRELVMGTMDPIGVMTLSLHQLSPDHFPQEYKCVIDPVSHEEHNQLKSGGGVKKPANLNSAVERVRKTLTWLRRTVYDYVTCMARFVPANVFGEGVVRMTEGSESLPPQAMSDFLSMCLYPLAISESQFVSLALTTASSYLTAIKSRIGADVIDAVTSRQLFYVSKDLTAFIYAVSVGGCSCEAAKKVLVMKSGPGAALAVIPPKEATLPFMGSSEGIDVVLAALQCVLFDGHDLRSAFTLSLLVWNTTRNRRNSVPNTDPAQIQQLMELMCKVFAIMVVGTMTNPFVDRPDTRPSLAGYLCDLYLAEFPRLTSAFTTSYPFIPEGKALVALDAPHTDSKSTAVENLHARMVAGRTDRHKRELFTSFIHEVFGVVSAPPPSTAPPRGGGGGGRR